MSSKNTTHLEQLHSFQGLSSSFFTNNATKKPSNNTSLYSNAVFFCMKDTQESLFMYLTYLTVALAKLKTVPQKHKFMYPTSKSTHSQSRQVLKRITSVHLGAWGVHNRTIAKIKHHCHKLYQLWNSQSQPFAADKLLLPRYKPSDTWKEMVISFPTSAS